MCSIRDGSFLVSLYSLFVNLNMTCNMSEHTENLNISSASDAVFTVKAILKGKRRNVDMTHHLFICGRDNRGRNESSQDWSTRHVDQTSLSNQSRTIGSTSLFWTGVQVTFLLNFQTRFWTFIEQIFCYENLL